MEKPDLSRRRLPQVAGTAGLMAGISCDVSAQHEGHDMSKMDMPTATPAPPPPGLAPPSALKRYPQGDLPVRTLNGWTLPYKLNGGVKEIHLVAEEIEHEFAPGSRAKCWGYNGTMRGPTIEAVEGDRGRIFVTNRLGEWTSVHRHGIDQLNGFDGVGGLNQPHIKPGETFVHESTLQQHGSHVYHPHAHEMTQMAFGMMGLFIIHPKDVEPEHSGHVAMGLPGPANTLPMMTGEGQFGPIEMGGMFTVVKVRDYLKAGDHTDPGWYRYPKDKLARKVSADPNFRDPPQRDPYGKSTSGPSAQPAVPKGESMPGMDHSKHGQ